MSLLAGMFVLGLAIGVTIGRVFRPEVARPRNDFGGGYRPQKPDRAPDVSAPKPPTGDLAVTSAAEDAAPLDVPVLPSRGIYASEAAYQQDLEELLEQERTPRRGWPHEAEKKTEILEAAVMQQRRDNTFRQGRDRQDPRTSSPPTGQQDRLG